MEEPVLRWERGRLLAADGGEATDAQRAKARRYLKDGLIKHVAAANTGDGWGQPATDRDTYLLEPVPGCRQQRRVVVTTYWDSSGNLRGITYRCDCQRAGGTVAVAATVCSHALAVHMHRRDDTRGA